MRLGGEGEGWIWGDPNEGCGRGLVCDEVGGRWRGVIMICCIGKGVINLIYFTLIFDVDDCTTTVLIFLSVSSNSN